MLIHIFLFFLIAAKTVIEGVDTIKEGAAIIGQSAVEGIQNKGGKLVDAAGNVYTLLERAADATKDIVVDAAGVVYEVTKSTAGFLIDSVLQYPQDVADDIKEAVASAQASAQNTRESIGMVGQMVKNSIPELPPIGKMLHPVEWGKAIKATGMKLSENADIMYDQLDALYDGYSAKYCVESQFTPAEKVPATFTGPSFFFELGMGGCSVNEAILSKTDKSLVLDCSKPYMTYGHRNASYVSKYLSAATFTSKDCKLEKTQGEYDELVLFVFDGRRTPNPQEIGEKVNEAVKGAVGELAAVGQSVVGQVTDFVGSLPELKKKELPYGM